MADVIIEAAARALLDICEADIAVALLGNEGVPLTWEEADERLRDHYRQKANAMLAAVTPLIRAATLEHAASMAEEYFSDNTISGASPQWVADEIAAMIRSFKEQP